MKTEKTIHTAKAARLFDQKAIMDYHIPSIVLMEHAAKAMADDILTKDPQAERVAIFCGPGNNGGDGLALARLLAGAKKEVTVLIDEQAGLSEDEKIWLESVRSLEIPVAGFEGLSPKGLFEKYDLIVDALFGSGLNRPLSGTWKNLVEIINESGVPVISCDIPSGINGNTGKGETAVMAGRTLALDCMKTGHILNQGKASSGKVEVLDISIPEFLHEQDPDKIRIIDAKIAAGGLPERSRFLNKGRFGKILMSGGSLAMQGALAMAAKSCFHGGIGTLTLFTPESAAMALASKMDLAMILSAEQVQGFFSTQAAERLKDLVPGYTFASCGNGMGRGLGAQSVTEVMLKSDLGLVLDADGINCAAMHPEWLQRKAPLILTPHLAEFSRISGFPLGEIEEDPVFCIRGFLKKYPNVILVLKSDVTFVADSSRISVLNHPLSALSKGGSGDVLCGLVLALCAQAKDPYEACCSAVWIHNKAARMACFRADRPQEPDKKINPACFSPLDLIAHYSDVFNGLEILQEEQAES